MAHQKTIEAYAKAGLNYSDHAERGFEVCNREKHEQIKLDPNPLILLQNVYRTRIMEAAPSNQVREVVTFDRLIIGVTGVSRKIETYEDKDQTSIWYEPICGKKIVFNSITETHEEVPDTEDFRVITHYIYEFNKETISMIKKMSANNARVNWYVKDEQTGFVRTCENFEQWSSGSFEEVLAPKMSRDILEKQALQRQLQYH